jgi:hypothetical protein
MMKSAWGSDDPTKAALPFLHGLALSEAGHSVQIFLLGEADRSCENRSRRPWFQWDGRPWNKRLPKWLNGMCKSTPAAPEAAPGRSSKAIWTIGERSSVIRQYSSHSSSGPIA